MIYKIHMLQNVDILKFDTHITALSTYSAYEK